MNVIRIGEPQIIMNNPDSRHNYFAWPTAVRLQNGKIAVAASGFRTRHICPFGKTVLAFSEDEGESYTAPFPVIDTVLDDRDGGVTPFGEKSVIVTSFNNTVAFQRSRAKNPYDEAYLDQITPEEEEKYLGATFRISPDGGVSFGPLHKSPVTSPHGPVELPDGSLLWVGRTFSPENKQMLGVDFVQAHRILPDGSTEHLGTIDNITLDGATPLSCEPHAIVLKDGSILAHIRVQNEEPKMFTIFQSRSTDGGRTWSKPEQILPLLGGSPPHLFRRSDGLLLCTYAQREKPCGIKVMFSRDEGKSWEVGHDIYVNDVSWDLGYPSTVELRDGSLLTVFYARMEKDAPAVIAQQKWKIADDNA